MSETTAGPTALDVDAAVRSVLSGLSPVARGVGDRNGTSEQARGNEVFAGRLLSVRQAEMLPARVREVKVAPGTVVTPLASDLLKRRGIAIRFVARSEAAQAGQVGTWGFAIETVSGVVEALRRSLVDGGDGWHDLGSSADDAARWVSEMKSRGALVLTDEASTAVYRACQVAGVRAATADDAGTTMRAVKALGVNLLVVEPLGKPIALLRQIGATFRRGGAPSAPGWIEPISTGGRAS